MVEQSDRRFSLEFRGRLLEALEDSARENSLQVHPSFIEALINYSEMVGVRELANVQIGTALGTLGALALELAVDTRDQFDGTAYAYHVLKVPKMEGVCPDPWSTCSDFAKTALQFRDRWDSRTLRWFPRFREFSSE